MSYGYEKRISYSECDGIGVLRYDALVDIFQDCSTFQSEDKGLTLTKMLSMHRGWMLSFWQIDIEKMPVLGDNVYVGTAPYGLKGCIGNRNFFMRSADGEYLVRSNSVWVLMDLENQVPVKIPDMIHETYEISEKLDMEYLPRKLKLPETPVVFTSKFTVERFALDSNGHMNNAWYVRLAGTAVPPEAKDRNLARICVEYKKQARLGDEIILETYGMDDGFFIDMRGKDGISYAIYYGRYA